MTISTQKYLGDSHQHGKECHERWHKRMNTNGRTTESLYAPSGEQCLFCLYFLPITGKEFIDDYGVCSNSKSQFDGIVRFEHDGCSEFVDDGEAETKE